MVEEACQVIINVMPEWSLQIEARIFFQKGIWTYGDAGMAKSHRIYYIGIWVCDIRFRVVLIRFTLTGKAESFLVRSLTLRFRAGGVIISTNDT